MAGSQGGSTPQDAPLEPVKPRAKVFSCSACGAPVTIRVPGESLSAVCSACLSVIDVSDENYRILKKYFARKKLHEPLIPLGSRGKIKGRLWEVIGFLVRRYGHHYWEEYLLFNPYYGYRWLTNNSYHWSFVTPLREKPEGTGRFVPGISKITFNQESYSLFFSGSVEVSYVLGEFYWKVAVGSSLNMADYINPPLMLSCEEDKKEINWSLAEYLQSGEVAEAFSLKWQLNTPVGVGANQPSPATAAWRKIGQLWMLFLAMCVGVELLYSICSPNKTVYSGEFFFPVNRPVATVTTPVFAIDSTSKNLEITFEGNVDNSWFYVGGELVNEDTDESYSFEQTLEYYHGYEGGESWSEGSRKGRLLLPGVPAGKYFFNLDASSGDFPIRAPNFQLEMLVKKDVPRHLNFFLCAFFVSILPVLIWWRSRQDEVARWSNSDYSPYFSDSSGD